MRITIRPSLSSLNSKTVGFTFLGINPLDLQGNFQPTISNTCNPLQEGMRSHLQARNSLGAPAKGDRKFRARILGNMENVKTVWQGPFQVSIVTALGRSLW